MPFTPFHLGPGIAIKAVMQGSFSLMVFGWAQIVMDVQPLVVMITGQPPSQTLCSVTRTKPKMSVKIPATYKMPGLSRKFLRIL